MDKKAVARSTLAKKLADDIRDRFVRQEEFYDHVNETVFKPNLGIELTRQTIKNILYGLADQINIVTLAGSKVRFGKLGTFLRHITPSGQRYNPMTKKTFDAPERRKLVFRSSKSTRRLFGHVSPDVDAVNDS